MSSPPAPHRRSLVAGCAVASLVWFAGGSRGSESGGDSSASEGEIVRLLGTQRDAWNRGDIEAFLAPYWKSDALTFASGGEVRRGFDATRDRYLKAYPDREAMGQLTFSDLETTLLAPDAALVLGTWRLERAAGPVGGNFTLVLRRLEGAWTIVHDHTSRRPDSP